MRRSREPVRPLMCTKQSGEANRVRKSTSRDFDRRCPEDIHEKSLGPKKNSDRTSFFPSIRVNLLSSNREKYVYAKPYCRTGPYILRRALGWARSISVDLAWSGGRDPQPGATRVSETTGTQMIGRESDWSFFRTEYHRNLAHSSHTEFESQRSLGLRMADDCEVGDDKRVWREVVHARGPLSTVL